MLYDGDAAGVKAALRGTDLILEEGMNVRIVVLPSPTNRRNVKAGAEGFGAFIKSNRKDLISFKASIFADEAKKTYKKYFSLCDIDRLYCRKCPMLFSARYT